MYQLEKQTDFRTAFLLARRQHPALKNWDSDIDETPVPPIHGTAQAQEFARADISIVAHGEGAGALECSFRETGLGAFASVTYSCGATDLGVLTQCFVRNKPVGGSTPVLTVFHNVTAEESEALLARNNGAISATIEVAVPEAGGGEEACTEPAVATVTAARWCNASLVDTTNNIVGATVAELFLQLERNATGTIPDCATLATLPGSGGGENGGGG